MKENAKVKQHLQSKSIAKMLAYGESVTQMMEADQTFSALDAKIAEAAQATSDLDAAKNAKDTAVAVTKAATTAQHNKKVAFVQAFTSLGRGVNDIAKGDKVIIDRSGMDSFFPGKATPIGELAHVASLSVTEGDNPGEIDLHWDTLKGARSYLIEVSITGPGSWAFSGTSTKSSHTIAKLQSGTTYWFRVAGVGSAGQGPFSDPATKVAP